MPPLTDAPGTSCLKSRGFDLYFFRFANILLRNRMMFMTMKKAIRIISVRYGLTGARVASSIIGKPKTMAGKF